MRLELRWSDIGHATESGRYSFRGSEIDVQTRHIYAWEQDPDSVWEVQPCRSQGAHTLRHPGF